MAWVQSNGAKTALRSSDSRPIRVAVQACTRNHSAAFHSLRRKAPDPEENPQRIQKPGIIIRKTPGEMHGTLTSSPLGLEPTFSRDK